MKGEPLRFIRGHATAIRRVIGPPHPCDCGCGEIVTAVNNGQRNRFLHGHNPTRLAITETDYTAEDRGYETPCWIWQKHLDPRGYGRVAYRGKIALAHRRMYEQHVGPIPPDLEIDHLCRQPACIRPSHCEAVPHRENVRRGRAQKLSDVEVAAIIADPRSQRIIAQDYGISRPYVCNLKKGRASRLRT